MESPENMTSVYDLVYKESVNTVLLLTLVQ